MQAISPGVSRASRRGIGRAILGALIIFLGGALWQGGLAGAIGDALPRLSQHSIRQLAQIHVAALPVEFKATVDTRGRTNPEFDLDVQRLTPPSQRRRVDAQCRQLHGSHIWSCDTVLSFQPGVYQVQWVVFFNFPGGVVNGNRSLVTLPTPAETFTVTGTVAIPRTPLECGANNHTPPCP